MARTPRIHVTAQNVDIGSIEPYHANPRIGDVSAIAESLAHNGQYRPIVVNQRTNEILAGNHTWKAAKSLGWKKIAVTFIDVDETEARRIVLADNRTHDLGLYDNEGLLRLLESLPNLDGTAFDEWDVEHIESAIGIDPGLFHKDPTPQTGKTPDGRVVVEVGIYRLLVDPDAWEPWEHDLSTQAGGDDARAREITRVRLGFPAEEYKPSGGKPKTRKRRIKPTGGAQFAFDDIAQVPIGDLRPFDGNARQGDVGAISESLRVNGQYRPIVVNRRDEQILVGNHTWLAAKALGWDTIAVAWVDVDEETAARIVLADNRTADLGRYDEQALLDLLTSLPDFDGTGFDGDDVDELIASITGTPLVDLDKPPTVACHIGKYRSRIAYDAWTTWEDHVRQEYGWSREDVTRCIIERLGLPGDAFVPVAKAIRTSRQSERATAGEASS